MPTSISVALYPERHEGANTLLRNADAAMYAAKHGRRNDFACYTHALTDHACERVRLEHDRHVAIDERQLEFYLQPQVSLTDTRIVGAELLLRWHHPTRGLLTPVAFIEVANPLACYCSWGNGLCARHFVSRKTCTNKAAS